METKKLISGAKTIDTLAKIIGKIFQIVGIVCIVFAALVAIFGEKMFAPGSLTMELGFVKLHLSEQYQTVTSTVKLYTAMSLISAAILCAVVFYISGCVRKLMQPMLQGRPFETQVAQNLRKTGWAVLIGGGLMELFSFVEHVIQANHYPLAQLISVDAVEKIEYTFSFDLGFALIAGVLFFMSYVFAYGQKLQQQADETL